MPATIIALQALLILLPGFATAAVVQALSLRAQKTDFERVVDSALYSSVIYGAFLLLHQGRLPFTIGSDSTITWQKPALLLLVAITAVLALVTVAYINYDGTRVFRWVRLTERTSRRSVWNDVFQTEARVNQVVQVELEGDRSVIGVMTYYADDSDEASLFIEAASWVKDGRRIPINGVGVLLTKAAGIRSVALLDDAVEPSHSAATHQDASA